MSPDPRPAARGRHPDALLLRRAQHRGQVHQHRPGRQAAAGRARGQAARRDLRRRPRRRQLRLHRGRGGDRGRRRARHDLLRHPRVLRQLAGHALPDLGDEQVPQHGASRSSRWWRWRPPTPAKVINRAPKLGTLQVGAPADVSVLEVVEGPVEFVDTRNNKRQGKVHLKPAGTVAGRRAVRPALPGAVRGALRRAPRAQAGREKPRLPLTGQGGSRKRQPSRPRACFRARRAHGCGRSSVG